MSTRYLQSLMPSAQPVLNVSLNLSGSQLGRTGNITLLIAISYLLLFLAIGVAIAYQLAPSVRLLTPTVCILIAAFGFFQPRRIHFGGYLFTAYVILIALMSLTGVMNRSWTQIFDERLLVQQASAHALVPLTAMGWALIFRHVHSALHKMSVLLIIPLSVAIAFVYANTDQVGMTDSPYVINNLYSMEVFRIFMVAVIALSLKRSILFLAVLVVFLFFSFSLQAVLCALSLLIARYFRVRMGFIWLGVFLIFLWALITTLHWEFLLAIDNNIGARALFWHNALSALLDTAFAGVGYGTESIVPFYPANGVTRYFGPAVPNQYQVIGVHGSVFQILFHTGIIGFALLFSWILRVLQLLGRKANELRGLDFFVVAVLTLTLFANMALDSYNFILGTSFLLGWMLYRAEREPQASIITSQTKRGEVIK